MEYFSECLLWSEKWSKKWSDRTVVCVSCDSTGAGTANYKPCYLWSKMWSEAGEYAYTGHFREKFAE